MSAHRFLVPIRPSTGTIRTQNRGRRRPQPFSVPIRPVAVTIRTKNGWEVR
jgi:hypothetical protein